MVVCEKCGAIIPFAGGSCTRCGIKAGGSNGFGQAANNPYGNGNNIYANKPQVSNPETEVSALIKKLERYKDLLGECDELKAMIKPQNNFPVSLETNFQKRSFIKYFWPFLAGGIAAASVIYFVVALIIVLSTPTAVRNAQGYNMGDAYAGYVVALIVAAIIIFLGYKIAKKKQADFNNNAELMNREMAERYNKGLENQRMINLFQENQIEMKKYEQLVPKEYRSVDMVGAIVEKLKEGKAENVEEACILI